MNTQTESEIIARRPPAVRHRARLEMAIVNALIDRAKTTGHRLRVRQYEEQEDYSDSDEGYNVRSVVFDLDMCSLELEVIATGERWGWILLVFGNDGWDLISDYTTDLEHFIAPINALARRLERGEYTVAS